MANEGKPASDVRGSGGEVSPPKPVVMGLKDTMAATQRIVDALEPFTTDQRRTILSAVASLAGVRQQGNAQKPGGGQQPNGNRR